MREISIVFGESRPDYIKQETLATIFKSTCSLFPNKIALYFNNNSISYQELDRQSDSLAAYLQWLGLHKGASCLVWWPRGIELHIAILAIVKCGATYIPIDFEVPQERVETIMQDSKSSFLISPHSWDINAIIINSIAHSFELNHQYIPPVFDPDDFAYVLFTSGSTGKPKGIPITQKNICHLIRSENSVLNILSSDKVYQGFSVSFDMWCEETWISYLVGASLWIADEITAKSIDELHLVLKEQAISVLHAVPSLLAVMESDDLDSIRLINSGGEACNQQVLKKWAVGNRVFYNSYGPTETTVSCSFAKLRSGDPITIGSPLPNYGLAVVDQNMNPVPIGEEGELIVTGVGVSHGYLNLDQLTKEKFLPMNPNLAQLPGSVFYRTGDAVYMDKDKNIHFIGRFDDQIKLRGYRIELSEIEKLLSDQLGVIQAAVTVKKDANDQEHLTAYVLMNSTVVFDEEFIKNNLALKLPNYMIPYCIVKLDKLPRLASGKIDRKQLPVPEKYLNIDTSLENEILESDDVGTRILKILSNLMARNDLNLDHDFFNDLGGHSLLAASFVSKIRNDAGVANASLKEIYQYRPLSELANHWEKSNAVKQNKNNPFQSIPPWRYFWCGLAQGIALLIIFGFLAGEIYIPYLAYYFTLLNHESHLYAAFAAILMFCIIPPIYIGFGIIVKWLVIGRYKEGEYPLWGTYYFRWWFVTTFQHIVPTQFLNGTPLYPVYLKLLGVSIAPDVQLSSLTIGAYDLITIGEDVCISSNVVLDNMTVENGLMKLSRISIGNHAYIGSSSIVSGNTYMNDWSELQDLSNLTHGQTIPYAEVWKGSPAKFSFLRQENDFIQPLEVSSHVRRVYKMFFSIMLLVFPFFILIPLIPTIVVLSELDNASGYFDFSYIWVTPFLTVIYIALFVLENICVSRLLQMDIQPGKYPLYSWFYLKKWMVDQMNAIALIVLHPIYATVFVTPYFRALGAKIGKNTEISTASNVTHPLLSIGDRSFIADSVTLGEADVRGQQLILNTTHIANNSFVGNSALIPQGYSLNSDFLIGVLSVPPTDEQLQQSQDRDWFGTPAIGMPKRAQSHSFSDSQTFTPSKIKWICRSSIEFIRIILPQTVILISSILFIAYSSDLLYYKSISEILLKLPFYYLMFIGIPVLLVTVILKWIVVGKYNTANYPMWNIKVWNSEFITSTYEALSVPFLLEYMKGTPFLPFFLRFFGVRIGKRAFLNTTDFTEFDMITLGDDVALNEDSGAQTHLFEDRVMKIGAVRIDHRVTVGSRSIILYDSHIQNDVKIDALSLIMKGEILQKDTCWGGSPVIKI